MQNIVLLIALCVVVLVQQQSINVKCSCGVETVYLGQLKNSLVLNEPVRIVSSNESIVAVWVKGYIDGRNISNVLSNRRVILFNPISEIYQVSNTRMKVLESSFTVLLQMYNISTSPTTSASSIRVKSIISAQRIHSDCGFGSPLVDFWPQEEGPIIITTDRDLPKMLRLARANNKFGRYLQMEDLNIVRLAPLYFSYSNLVDQNVVSCIADQQQNFTSTCNNFIKSCRQELNGKDSTTYHTSCYWNHDHCLLRSSGVLLSNSSLESINFMNFLQTVNPKATMYFNDSHSTMVLVDESSFVKSEFYECSSSTCALEPVTYEHIHVVYVLFFICVYYVGLLFTANTKSIKIRLASPYICPLFVLLRGVFQTSIFSLRCTRIYNGLANVVVIFPVVLYAMTLVRYFYLRNLFSIISKSDNFKLYKFLASKWFGLVTSLIIPLILSGLSFLMMIDAEIYLTSDMAYFRNGPLGVILVIGFLMGFVFLIFDMISNRKKIQKKGLYYYFFFDDPFYMKIDLVIMVILLVLVILTMILNSNTWAIAVLLVFASVFCYLILGGNSIIIELYTKIKKKLSKKGTDEKDDMSIEFHLDDIHLMKLLKKFAMKEFSIENVLLFEILKSIENSKNSNASSKSTITTSTDSLPSRNNSVSLLESESSQCYLSFEQACQIEELYIRNYSKFEVNLPNHTKKEFYKWFEDQKQQFGQSPTLNSIKYSELKEILLFEVLENVNDTFSRMEETAEYKKWLKLTELQKENELYDL